MRALTTVWAWASPLAWLWAAALLIAALLGARTRMVAGTRVFFLKRIPFRPNTRGAAWGGTWVAVVADEARLIAHEVGHVELQHRRYGPLMIPIYWILYLRDGYANHPFEIAARAFADDIIAE